jgi:hypothetical protein
VLSPEPKKRWTSCTTSCTKDICANCQIRDDANVAISPQEGGNFLRLLVP